MAQRTRAELNSDADTFLPDNNNNEIDALDVRQRVKDLADSSLNVQDNLTDLTDAPAARSALGLGSAATRAVGSGALDVAAGNHTHAMLADGVVVTSAGGTRSIHTPSADTNADRGTALAAALAAAVAGDHVLVPPGTYDMAAGWTFPAGITLQGAGKAVTNINLAGNAITLDDDVTIRDVKLTAANIVGVTINRLVLAEVVMDGTGMAATTDMIHVSGLYSFSLRFINCELANGTASGYNLRNASDIQFIGGSVRGCAEHGIELYESGQHLNGDPRSNSPVILGTVCAGNTGDGIFSWGDHDLRLVGVASEYNDGCGVRVKNPIQTTIASCIFEYNGTTAFSDAQLLFDLDDISLQSVNESNVSVNGCTFSADPTNVHLVKILGTHDASYNLVFSGNNFQDPSSASQTTGISCTDYKPSYGFNINGNYFSGFNGVGDKAINLGPSAGTITPKNVLITGNVFDGFGLYALHIYGMTDVVIHGNLFDGNTNALFSNAGAGSFRLSDNTFRNSSGSVVDLTGSTATYVAVDNDGLADTEGVWTAWTPNVLGTLTNPTKSASKIENGSYSARGKVLRLSYKYLTGGTPGADGSGTYSWTLPAGYTIDTAAAPSGTIVGACQAGSNVGVVRVFDGLTVELFAGKLVGDDWFGFADTNIMISFQATLPIL